MLLDIYSKIEPHIWWKSFCMVLSKISTTFLFFPRWLLHGFCCPRPAARSWSHVSHPWTCFLSGFELFLVRSTSSNLLPCIFLPVPLACCPPAQSLGCQVGSLGSDLQPSIERCEVDSVGNEKGVGPTWCTETATADAHITYTCTHRYKLGV